MAKNDSIQNENNWDSGTYQTGSSNPGKGNSGLVTVLLVAVIFLGGMASALGLMNVRLLAQLTQQQNAVLPMSVDATTGSLGGLIREQQEALPQLPQERELSLKVGQVSPVPGPVDLKVMATITVQTSQGHTRTGPALILSSDGYLLTNAHLLKNAAAIQVTLFSGEALPALLVASDAYSDLSVLYVQAQGLSAAEFAPVEAQAGDGVQIPEQCEALTEGRVQEGSQCLTVGADTLTLQETDFDTDHGPVFNAGGQVTGFLCRYFGQEEAGQMLSAGQVMEIAQQLVTQGAVSGRPYLGLQLQTLSSFFRQYWGLSGGLEIIALDSAVEELGLRQGDILLRLNGRVLTDMQQLHKVLLYSQSLELEVFRAGQCFAVTLPVVQVP